MTAFWEPFRLKPGDLAVVRISPECPTTHLGWRGPGGYKAVVLGPDWTRRRLNGQVVEVVAHCPHLPDDPEDADDGHDYYVHGVDDPMIDDFLAACELLPVEDDLALGR